MECFQREITDRLFDEQAFIPVAGKRGGNAKIVGNVVKPPSNSASLNDSRGSIDRPEQDWWNEISIVHYPSIRHFCDMLAGDDYQAINEKYRLKVSSSAGRWVICSWLILSGSSRHLLAVYHRV